MLPLLALGHSQSSIIASANFENKVLHLAEVMIPNVMSSTMSSKLVQQNNTSKSNSTNSSAGRPEKDNEEKSDKTIANRNSMGKE